MEGLINRLRQSGFLLLVGCLLIVYIALSFVYFQQGPKQRELDEQIAKLNLIVSKPLPSADALQAAYDKVTTSLSANITPLATLVKIAQESGIDVSPDSTKIQVPPVLITTEKIGVGSYQVLFFRNIRVQGNYDNVTAFISAIDSGEIVLDSGETLKTMVLKRVSMSQTEDETTAQLDVNIYTKPRR